jgi:hypothetical protein
MEFNRRNLLSSCLAFGGLTIADILRLRAIASQADHSPRDTSVIVYAGREHLPAVNGVMLPRGRYRMGQVIGATKTCCRNCMASDSRFCFESSTD